MGVEKRLRGGDKMLCEFRKGRIVDNQVKMLVCLDISYGEGKYI